MNNKIAIKIRSDIKSHLVEYLILFITGVLFLILMATFRGQHNKQFFILILFVCYYITWGYLHHEKDQTLSLKIIMEYVLFGGLALLLLKNLLI